MNIENQITMKMQERGGREIKLTESEYSKEQHELCLSLAEQLYGDKGLIRSLGPMWFMVMDDRFFACENIWVKKTKITASEHGYEELGLTVVDDLGNVGTARMISLEQYAEMIGEGRHYIEAVKKLPPPENDPKGVVGWDAPRYWGLIGQECPNYFTRENTPNELAQIHFKMLGQDWLGLISDYCPVPNLDQWVTVEHGQVVQDPSQISLETPCAHAEIEYLDRALNARAVLRANTIKVLSMMGGRKLAYEFGQVMLTESEKDRILQLVFQYDYDQIYQALPGVLQILKEARKPFSERVREQELNFIAIASKWAKELQDGTRKPLNLITKEDQVTYDKEEQLFSKISNDEHLVALFYILTQSEGMVEGYPEFQVIVDRLLPIIELAEPINDFEFQEICQWVQGQVDRILDTAVVIHKDPQGTEISTMEQTDG